MSTIKERFDCKWKETEEGCWIWHGFKDTNGYGRLHLLGKNEFAHRISYELYKGGVILKDQVLHECDNPSCVNPAHLFLGTHKDNMKDMVRKGRQNRGVKNAMHKLTEEQVVSIRHMHQRLGVPQTSLAEMFLVSRATICGIVNNKSWKHIHEE